MFVPIHDKNALDHIRIQYVTLGIILVNVLVWIFTTGLDSIDVAKANAIYYAYGFVPALVNDYVVLPADYPQLPEAFSYLTYAFIHADFFHLAGNMLFVWVFGDNVEDATGHLKFLVFYLLCAAAAAFAHGLVFPISEAPLVGASGAAAGLVGAYLMLHPTVWIWVLVLGRIPLRLPAVFLLGAWIAYQVFSLVVDPESQVSWIAHVGGAVAGILLVPVLKRRGVPLFDRGVQASAPEKSTAKTGSNQSGTTWGRPGEQE